MFYKKPFAIMRYILVLLFSLVANWAIAQNVEPTTSTPVTKNEAAASVPSTPTTTTTSAAPEGEAKSSSEGERKPAPKKKPTTTTKKPASSSNRSSSAASAERERPRVSAVYSGKRERVKSEGFRVQVYSGPGNTASKNEAKTMAAKMRQRYPELSVYCHFKSPRWVCRVGDFSTREAASRYLNKIRKSKITKEASIVKEEVFLAQ